MEILEKLARLRAYGGAAMTVGLPDETVREFAASDPLLSEAVDQACRAHERLRQEFPEILAADERAQRRLVQRGLVNFYSEESVNPYVAIAARGPWVVTAKGAVLHDSGGYGMLGLGHAPEAVLAAMNQPQVMANVMTPSFSQQRISDALQREIGHTRAGDCPFPEFIFMNSGSEAVTVGARLSDVNAKIMTDPGGRHAGKPIRILSLRHGFHGRTHRPAEYSDSTLRTYRQHLASFRDRNRLLVVEPNEIEQLRAAFAAAEMEGFFIESMFMEPVMGEGDPGHAITREFYDEARRLTTEHGGLLLIDSIQAGLRTHGVLSVIDYPGFEDCEPPDMEAYSKALNAGQFPLSVLALNERAAGLYRKGVYGNTMTANPRALDVGCAVLGCITTELRENIRARGRECLQRFEALAAELDGPITAVQGTGLLFSCALAPGYLSQGADSTEEYLRVHGIGVIHGGENSLRFTPHFNMSSREIDLLVDATRTALLEGPHAAQEVAVSASAAEA